MNNDRILEIKQLTKFYGKKIVFQDLNLQINKGDRIALMGPNGVGKTTLVEMICGLRKINGGKIIFSQSKSNFFKNLGMQFQDGEYPLGVRVSDLIYLYSNVYNQEIGQELEKNFEISEIKNQEISSLSYGQRKRVELFLLLAVKLDFLILDEVTSGMDISIKIKILDFLEKYVKKNNCSLIHISHNLDEINSLCNRLVIMTKRGIVFDQKINPNFNVRKELENILQKEI